MNSDTLTLRFGDLLLCLHGVLPPNTEESYLWRFVATNTEKIAAIVTCEVRFAPNPYPSNGEVLFSGFGKRVVRPPTALEIATFCGWDECTAVLTQPHADPDALVLTLAATQAATIEHDILTSIAMEHLLLRHDHAIFHAAWFERGEEAVLFSGASGAGKSTHTALWAENRRVSLVNGDKCLLLWREGRLFAAGLPYAGSSGICCNRTLPVRAIVLLSHGNGENRLRRLSISEAAKALLTQMPVQKWCAEDVSAALEIAIAAAERLPIYAYACLPDASAVDFLERKLFTEEGSC